MGEIKKFEQVEVEKLIPYINNAKKHDEAQVTKIASSIREFGFLNPVLIDKKFNVLAGHGRILAAKKLGLDKVPAIYAEGLTEAQRKAYILADNRLGELAEWDMDLVVQELDALKDMDFDSELTGFSTTDDDYINDLMENGLETGPAEVDEFAVTFTINKMYEDEVKAYIKDNGKEPLVQAILREIEKNNDQAEEDEDA